MNPIIMQMAMSLLANKLMPNAPVPIPPMQPMHQVAAAPPDDALNAALMALMQQQAPATPLAMQHQAIPAEYKFCPYCGTSLKKPKPKAKKAPAKPKGNRK